MKDSILSEFFDEIEFSRPKPDICEDIMKMDFKPIKGFPGYEIFEDGSIWSNKRQLFLVPNHSGTNRYPKVNLYDANGKRCNVRIHKVVAEAFLKKPKHPEITTADWRKTPLHVRKIIQSDYQVDHIDGDRDNFHVSNLRWVTAKQNLEYYHTEQKYL